MIYAFDDIQLDLDKMELRCGGVPSKAEPQVFALIAFLVQHRDRMVSRGEILENVWAGRVVSDSALSSRIKAARQAIGDDGTKQRSIKTVHGHGFRFVADVDILRSDISSISVPKSSDVDPDTPSVSSRPSIAVLPFTLIGEPGLYSTIADGLPHELIAELSRVRWLFVIARPSSFQLRGQQLDLRSVGQVLGVRYCLTGTVELLGTKLTVMTELVDTRSGHVFWAERFSGSVKDMPAMREEIRSSVLSSLEIHIPIHEASAARLSNPADLDAWSAYHLGLQHLYRFNRKDNLTAKRFFTLAIKRDPEFARAHAGLSSVHFKNAFMNQSDDVAGEIQLARQLAQRGVDLDPLDPFVNYTMGRSFWLDADLDQALAWLDQSISLSPNYAHGVYARSWTESMAGNGSDAILHADLAMKLSPLDPLYYAMLGARALGHIAREEYTQGAEWADRAARSPGAHVLIEMIAACARMMAGDADAADAWAIRVRSRRPKISRHDFFHAFPIKEAKARLKMDAALKLLEF